MGVGVKVGFWDRGQVSEQGLGSSFRTRVEIEFQDGVGFKF